MIDGVVIGIVTDNVDPDNLCRIKVEFKVDSDPAVESTWIRMIRPMAGKDRGLVAIPEVGSEVVLGFAYRTLTPYVLGALHNGQDAPPYANDDKENNLRVFKSRSGHEVTFDDTSGAKAITVGSTSGAVVLKLDDPGGTLTAESGDKVQVEADSKIEFKCVDFKVKASGSISLEASGQASYKASASGTWEATSSGTWKGSVVKIN